MAREGITFDQVAHAADTLVGEGKSPTIKAIREAIGTGSPNTVHRHLTAWRATRPQAQATARELPAKIIDAINEQIEQATASARADIEGQLVQVQAEAADLAAAGEALEGERDALIDQVATLTTERDTLSGKAAQQAADLVAAIERIDRERKLAGEAQTEAATARLKIEGFTEKLAEQADELARLRAALEASQEARQAAQQAGAVTAARLEACQEAHAAAEAREQAAQSAAQVSARELSTANLAVQAGQARLEAAARELEEARRQVKDAREAARKAGEDAAELRGKLSVGEGKPKVGKAKGE